jgi:hypothetical protein
VARAIPTPAAMLVDGSWTDGVVPLNGAPRGVNRDGDDGLFREEGGMKMGGGGGGGGWEEKPKSRRCLRVKALLQNPSWFFEASGRYRKPWMAMMVNAAEVR